MISRTVDLGLMLLWYKCVLGTLYIILLKIFNTITNAFQKNLDQSACKIKEYWETEARSFTIDIEIIVPK